MNRFDDIRDWAERRGLVRAGLMDRQAIKLMEEVGELAAGLARLKHHAIEDGIGDCIVVLTILAAQMDLKIEDCIEKVWFEIKDRRGSTVDGVFIKEGDQR